MLVQEMGRDGAEQRRTGSISTACQVHWLYDKGVSRQQGLLQNNVLLKAQGP